MTPSCDHVAAWIDDLPNLDQDDRTVLAAHLATCARCRALAAAEARIAPAFAATPSLTPSARLTAALMAVPSHDRRRRTIVAVPFAPLALGSLAALVAVALGVRLIGAPLDLAGRPDHEDPRAPLPAAAARTTSAATGEISGQAGPLAKERSAPTAASFDGAAPPNPTAPAPPPAPTQLAMAAAVGDAVVAARVEADRGRRSGQAIPTPEPTAQDANLGPVPGGAAGTGPPEKIIERPTDAPQPTSAPPAATPGGPVDPPISPEAPRPSETPTPNETPDGAAPPARPIVPETPPPTETPGNPGRSATVLPTASPTETSGPPSATPSPRATPTATVTATSTATSTSTSTATPSATVMPRPTAP